MEDVDDGHVEINVDVLVYLKKNHEKSWVVHHICAF